MCGFGVEHRWSPIAPKAVLSCQSLCPWDGGKGGVYCEASASHHWFAPR